MITDIKNVNAKTDEGKLVIAAVAKITTESQLDKTPNEVLGQLNELVNGISFDELAPKTNTITDEVIRELMEMLGIENYKVLKSLKQRKNSLMWKLNHNLVIDGLEYAITELETKQGE